MATKVIGRSVTTTLSGTLVASETILVRGGVSGGGPGGTAILDHSATVYGVVTVAGGLGGQSSNGPGGAGGTLVNTGVLTNSGTLTVGGGQGAQNYYAHGGQGGSLTNIGILTNLGAISIEGGTGAGRFGYIASGGFGGILTDGGALTNLGTIDVGGETSSHNRYDYGGSGGLLNVSGVLNNGGSIVLHGGQGAINDYNAGGAGAVMVESGVLVNTGSITVGGGGELGEPIVPVQSGADMIVSGVLQNAGSLTIGPGISGAYGATAGTVSVTGTLVNSGLVDLGGFGASLIVGGTLIESGTITGGGTVINHATIESGPGFSGAIETALVNDGLVSISAGQALTIGGGVTTDAGDSGVFQLGAGARMLLGGAVDKYQQITFLAPGAALMLASPEDFSAKLSNPQVGDSVDLLNTQAVKVVAYKAGLAVTLQNGSVIGLALAQPLSSDLTPVLYGDGHGGTDIGFLAGSAQAARIDQAGMDMGRASSAGARFITLEQDVLQFAPPPHNLLHTL